MNDTLLCLLFVNVEHNNKTSMTCCVMSSKRDISIKYRKSDEDNITYLTLRCEQLLNTKLTKWSFSCYCYIMTSTCMSTDIEGKFTWLIVVREMCFYEYEWIMMMDDGKWACITYISTHVLSIPQGCYIYFTNTSEKIIIFVGWRGYIVHLLLFNEKCFLRLTYTHAMKLYITCVVACVCVCVVRSVHKHGFLSVCALCEEFSMSSVNQCWSVII